MMRGVYRMLRNQINVRLLGFLVSAIFMVVGHAQGQLLISEIEADPGNQQNDSCQYVEIRGTPGATVAANTWFVAIDSDSAFPGTLNVAVNIGGQIVGSNGTLTLVNTFGTACPNRTYGSGTTVVNYNSPIRIGGGNVNVGSESFAIITTATNLVAGSDADTDDNGTLNFAANFIDAVAFIINPDEQNIYPANAAVLGTAFADVPDALVRFCDNSTPFSSGAYYWGEIAQTPDESLQFEAPLSGNFPNGGVLTPGDTNTPCTQPNPVVSRADFDGDGKTDLSVFRSSEGNWYLNGSTTGFAVVKWGVATDRVVPGDFDGDGRTDLAVFRPDVNPANSDFYILNSNNSTVSFYSWGVPDDVPLSGDYDGDGKTDIGVFRPAANAWYVLQSSNGETNFANFGLSGDIPLVIDNNGDGKDQFAVFRPSIGTWYIARPTGVPSQNFDTVVFGLPTDKPVPADYDGDNVGDVAVFRPSNGTWYIMRSSSGTVSYVTFGVSTDIPVPGDYDGDGTDDVAIYRGGTWWVSQSTSGLVIANFGTQTDIPIPAGYIP